jgi:LDH2 family malate/lactate/ureidoglycolate dehydrogenase
VTAVADPAREPADVRVTASRMRELAAQILCGAGAEPDVAEIVAASLVESDVLGVRSHGAIRLPDYLAAIHAGSIRPGARPRLTIDRGPLVAFDGMGAFGQVVAGELVREVARRARVHGVCLGTLAGAAHVGRLGEWVEGLVDDGLVAIAWCNCGDPGGNVAPFGGGAARLGTNPIAYGIPSVAGEPIIADFSTSAVAEGKVRVFRDAGETVPDGWIIDAGGRPSNDPRALYDGGALLPAGGHKGYALALLVEILGGVLAGGGSAALGEPAGNGLVLLAIDPAQSAAGARFGRRVAAIVEAIASTPAEAGGDGVLLPGAPERRATEQALREGFVFSGATWSAITRAACSVGVAPEA